MKNSKKTLIMIFGIIAVVLAAIGSAMLITAVAKEYDVTIGHFASDAIFAPVSYVVMGVGAVLAVVSAVLTTKAKIKPGKNAGAFLCFASVFAAILLVAASVFDLVSGAIKVDAGYNVFLYLTVLFGVLGAVGLFMFALSGSYRTGATNLLSMCLPLYFIVRTLVLYFDKTGAINSPVKVLTQLAFITYAVFTVFDAGIYVGREKILPRYMLGSILAITVGGSVSISALVSQFITEGCFELSVVDTCMAFAFFILACAKLHHVAFAVAEEEPETSEKTENEEEAAEAEVKEAEEELAEAEEPEKSDETEVEEAETADE